MWWRRIPSAARHGPEAGEGVLKGHNGIGVQGVVPRPVGDQLAAEPGGAGGDHVAVLPRRLRQPGVQLRIRLPGVEHIQSDNRRAAVLRLVKGFQHPGHYVPAPLIVGPNLLQGPLVDAHHHDVPVKGVGPLAEGVGGGPVCPVQHPQPRQQGQSSGDSQHGQKPPPADGFFLHVLPLSARLYSSGTAAPSKAGSPLTHTVPSAPKVRFPETPITLLACTFTGTLQMETSSA